MAMEDLPLELWFYISEFFTDEDLYNVMGVNRFFFDLAMDRRYREVKLGMDNRKLRAWLAHISQPNLARRIKRLNLQIHPINSEPRTTSTHVGESLFVNSIRRAINHILPSLVMDSPEVEPPIDINGMVEKLTGALPFMTAVEELSIVNSSASDLDEVYRLAWSVFGTSLRRLSICAGLNGYGSLIQSNPYLPALDTLELEFTDTPWGVNALEQGDILNEQLIPFVNSLGPQIKTLQIHSISRLDLSPLFARMEGLDNLKSMLIRIPFNFSLRQDPGGLKHLLHKSSKTLRHVALRLTPIGLALDPAADGPSFEWLTDCVSDPICFSRVETLDICPTNVPDGINVLSQCISNSYSQLKFFTVRDRYLKVEEVVALSKRLSSCTQLTYLRFNILQLSVEVFDALARDLPELRYLRLSIGETASSDHTPLESSFRRDLETRRYNDWKLWDLDLWRSGSELDDETMLGIARSIPSLRSFWGSGHMVLNDTQSPS